MTVEIRQLSTDYLMVEFDMAKENKRKAAGNCDLERVYSHKKLAIKSELIRRRIF